MGPIERELRKHGVGCTSVNGTFFYGEWALSDVPAEARKVVASAALQFEPFDMESADVWSEAIEAAEALGL